MKLKAALLPLLLVVVAGCGSSLDAARGSVAPTPTDFAGVVKHFAEHDFVVIDVVSGDPGCADPALIPMAIAFHLSGGGLEAPVQARIYRFKDDASYQKLRASVDGCAAEWINDPATLLMVDASPYVLVTEGVPEGAPADAIRTALRAAAGE
jgi:hypothetical protein